MAENYNNNNNTTYSYGGAGNPVPNQGDNAYSPVTPYNQYGQQYNQQYTPHNVGYTSPVGGGSNGGKSGGVSLSTVAISIASAAVIGLAGGFIGAKLGGNGSGETVLKSEDGTSVVFQAIDRTSDENSQSAYSVADVAKAVSNSVVEITTEVVSTNRFMGQYISQGAGSGVIFTADGYIMTNHHVIDGAQTITVTLKDGTSYQASIIGDDPQTDLALLKIDATGLTPAVLAADSNELQVGQTAIAIGNPLGQLGGTVTSGIVSALDREIEIDGETMNLLQTNAAINPGNSGGGLFDDNGNLIGIVNAKSSGSDIEGLGFAIPINTVKTVFTDLKEYGYVKGRVSLGISVISVDNAQTAWMYGVNETGLYVLKVESGSDAEIAGLKQGDKIVSFNGAEVQNDTDLAAEIKKCSVGDVATMVVRRDGRNYTVSITLSESKG